MSDNKKTLKCPACGQEMTKIYTKQGINVDICIKGCGGIWFDNRETDNFVKNEEPFEEIQAYIENKNFQASTILENRICPVCGTKMVQHLADPNSKVTIDECYSCGGKFLDYGELENIKNAQSDNVSNENNLQHSKNKNDIYNSEHNFVKRFLYDMYTKKIR